jgi:pyroglutamyl-peptidase
MNKTVLITGFEPYGGLTGNPSLDVAKILDGTMIAGHILAGRALPVSMSRIAGAIDALLAETSPAAVVSLGLAPGESAIRIERVGLNLADFAIADNDGHASVDEAVSAGRAPACWATLPVRRIHARLLEAGIPARMSMSAGTYLCNACMFLFAEKLAGRAPNGFLHLPLTPSLVASQLLRGGASLDDRGPPPSMSFNLMTEAARIAVAESLNGSA